ncbi:MAG: sugar phosphate isomerase/epimerase [Victivallales bacterium]|nr:sugar phosphate isomerase/epimerase [Victivallales bacterium]
MKLSVMLFPFQNGKYEPRQLVHDLAIAGATALEPMESKNIAFPDDWKVIYETAKDEGMSFSCYDLGLNLVGTSDQDRAEALEHAKRGFEFSREVLDCSLVMIPGSKPAEGMSNEEGRKIYGEQLGKAAEIAAQFGIKALIEDFGVYPYFSANSAHCAEVMKYAGPLPGFTFDNGNFLYGGEQTRDAFATFAPRTHHVHIKDFVVAPEDATKGTRSVLGQRFVECAIGEGITDVEWTIKSFLARGYDGFFSMEVSTLPRVVNALKYCATLAR